MSSATDTPSMSRTQTRALNLPSNTEHKKKVLNVKVAALIAFLMLVFFAIMGLVIGYSIGRRTKGIQNVVIPSNSSDPFDGESFAVCQFQQPDMNGTLRIEHDSQKDLLHTSVSGMFFASSGTLSTMHHELVVLKSTDLSRCSTAGYKETDVLNFAPSKRAVDLGPGNQDIPTVGRLATIKPTSTDNHANYGLDVEIVAYKPNTAPIDQGIRLLGRAVAITRRDVTRFDTKACCIIARPN